MVRNEKSVMHDEKEGKKCAKRRGKRSERVNVVTIISILEEKNIYIYGVSKKRIRALVCSK